MRYCFVGLFVLLAVQLHAQKKEEFDPDRKFHPDSLKQWTKDVMDELRKKQPGFYRYTSKQRFDFLIDSTCNTIHDSLTELEFYRKLKPLIAQIGCLHTGVTLSAEYQEYLAKTSTLFPFEIFIDTDKKVFVTKNHSGEPAPVKGELLSINGSPIGDIVKKLLAAIPSDGYNETEKILLLNHRFTFWYQTMIEATDRFNVAIRTSDGVTNYQLKGVSKELFPSLESLESNYEKTLEFEIHDKIGILKVHSFAKTDIKSRGQNFKKFMKRSFKQLKEEDVKDLIIDLRYNTGGSDPNAVLLSSYLFDAPYRYWDRIEVTEDLAREVKGLAKIIYGKPVRKDSTYIWKKSKFTREFDFYEMQYPSKNNFKGNVYLLTNGLCMSSCGDFTAIVSHNRKATVIGQETGGGYQGNTSGIMPTTKIPTGLVITVPLQKYTNSVDLDRNFGHGTIPDHVAAPGLNDWIEKKDVEMEYAMKLIKSK
jgi:hypothetical protein